MLQDMKRYLAVESGAVVALLVLAACAPAAQPPATTPAQTASPAQPTVSASEAAWQAEWDQTIAAAEQEGKLSLLGSPADVYRETWNVFEQKYGITVELLTGGGQDLYTRVTAERGAGQFLWDVMAHNSITLNQFKNDGVLQPLRPLLILPEVIDDAKWGAGGISEAWMDLDKKYVFAYVNKVDWLVHVNRQEIPESELNSIDQLWDEKWKGKVAWDDPRIPSAGTEAAATWLATLGEEKLRQLMRLTEPVLTRDGRQLGDWVVSGRYPIAIELTTSVKKVLTDAGVNIDHVQHLGDLSDQTSFALTEADGSIGLFTDALHPNAARVFLNWLLTKDGQTEFATRTGYNSRRVDVPPANPDEAVDPSISGLLNMSAEAQLAQYFSKAIDIATEELK